MTKRAVLYARVSSDDSRKDGRNLAGQLDMCRKYALEHGYTITAELHEDDRGASGAAFELPQLNRVREMAAAGEFDALIVREIDRLSRSLAKQLIVEEELRRAGVEVEYVLGEYPDTIEGGLMKNLRASIAEYERLKIHERMTRGRELKVKAGSVMMHGRPPFGYRTAERAGRFVLEVNESEAQTVRLIFQWYTTGANGRGPLSVQGVKNELDARHIPTYEDTRHIHEKTRGHGEWCRSVISKMLRSETYAGTWRYQPDRSIDVFLAVEVPPLVSRHTWQQAQARLDENKESLRRPPMHDYLMGRRLYCADCGARIIVNSRSVGKRMVYYLCQAKRQYARPCSMSVRFKADIVDAAVWQWVKGYLLNPERLTEGITSYAAKQQEENAPLQERLRVVEDLLRSNRTQLERLLDLYLGGEFSKELLTERKSRLEATISALDHERSGLLAHIAARDLTPEEVMELQEFAANVAAGLAQADEEDYQVRRKIIETLRVEGTLAVEDGQRVLYVRCLIDEKGRFIVDRNKDEERARGATLVCRSLTAPASTVYADPAS